MANVKLTKHDGEIVSVPAGSVTAILSTALDKPNPDKPNLRSVILTNYRGRSTYLLNMTAREARRLIDEAAQGKRKALITKPKPDWVELTASETDSSFFAPSSIQAYETIKLDEDEVRRLRVQFLASDGAPEQQDVDLTEENLERIDTAIEKGS